MDGSDVQSFAGFFSSNYATAVALAGFLYGITMYADTHMPAVRRKELSEFIANPESDSNWASVFIYLFDGIFGEKHLSPRCFFVSAAFSLVSVAIIWSFLGGYDTLSVRIGNEVSLGAIIPIALVVNVLADYLSLLQTRWMIGKASEVRRFWIHGLIIFADFLATAAIIWIAIWLFIRSPFYYGKVDEFASVIGVFSTFSVLFFSTFLTSVWSWIFFVSTWLLRAARFLSEKWIFDFHNWPSVGLSSLIFIISFLTAIIVPPFFVKDQTNTNLLERALCSVFGGQVCLDVSKLTSDERDALRFLLRSCETGFSPECLNRGRTKLQTSPSDAATLFSSACNGGDATSCAFLGIMLWQGEGIPRDIDRADAALEKACKGNDSRIDIKTYSCGVWAHTLKSSDPNRSASLALLTCEAGVMQSCTLLAEHYEEGVVTERDFEKAAEYFGLACDRGHPKGCYGLAKLLQDGKGVPRDRERAADLFKNACRVGEALACLAMAIQPTGGDEDAEIKFLESFEHSCKNGNAASCHFVGLAYAKGLSSIKIDIVKAQKFMDLACQGGEVQACNWSFIGSE